MSNQSYANRPPLDALEFPMASLYTPAPGSDRERASFNWSMLNGNPRVSVWTRVQGEKEKSPIQGGIGGPAMEALLEDMEDCFLGNGKDRRKFEIKTRPKTDDGSSTGDYSKVLTATLKYGVDKEDGLCWVMLESADEDRPKIVFRFRGFEWHPMGTADGYLGDAEASRVHALATVRYMRKMFIQHSKAQTQEERKARAEQFKQRKGGGQQPQQRSGGNRAESGSFNFGSEIDGF